MGREKVFILRCNGCGQEYGRQHVTKCRRCGELVDPVYDLAHARITPDSGNYIERYFDLLPLENLDLAGAECKPTPTLHARVLGRRFGLQQLWLKNEVVHPTRTTKDRMAAVTLSRFSELGISKFVSSSTGNSSTSFAYWLEQHGADDLHAYLFCGKAWLGRHQHCQHSGVSLTSVDGTFVEAGGVAKGFAEKAGIIWEGGFFNSSRREGLKTAYLEAFDEMPREPAFVIQAVSSGMGIYGAWRGAQQYLKMGRLRTLPRLVCVQQESCAPMARSFQRGLKSVPMELVVEKPAGLAEAILRGDPRASYPHLYRVVRESKGTFIIVSSAEIESVQLALFEDEGIEACPASAAAVAAAAQMRRHRQLTEEEVVLVNVAGGLRGYRRPTGTKELDGAALKQQSLAGAQR